MSNLYCLIDIGNNIIKYDNNIDPNVITKFGYKWLPVIDTKPSFDSVTQVMSGPVITVNSNNVTRVWSIRDKTAQELDDEKTNQIDDVFVSSINKALATALFQVINDVRVLKGQQQITVAQFKNFLKGLM